MLESYCQLSLNFLTFLLLLGAGLDHNFWSWMVLVIHRHTWQCVLKLLAKNAIFPIWATGQPPSFSRPRLFQMYFSVESWSPYEFIVCYASSVQTCPVPLSKAHASRFNVTLTAYALGEIFNEPWPPSLLTSGGMDEIDLPYPSDQLEFAVEVLCPKKVVS